MPNPKSLIRIDAEEARLLAATLNVEPPPLSDNPLPPCWHWIYLRPEVASSALREDGHPNDVAPHPDVGGWPRVWGAGTLTWHDDLRLGDTLSYERIIKNMTMKSGRSGRLCICDVAHRWQREDHLVLEEIQTVVYREPSAVPASRAEASGGPESASRSVSRDTSVWEHCFTEVDLFRYSALTFNSHRIHYDLKYARTVENYPELVVQGPLLATLAANFAGTMNKARRLSTFTYRILAPVFCGDIAGFSFDLRTGSVVVVSRGRIVLSADCVFHMDARPVSD